MANDDRNKYQIIRKDARGCFVEIKSDSFPIGKVHMEFAAYDVNKPAGQRFTNHVHIYLDTAEFYDLSHAVLHGHIHPMMSRHKKTMQDAESHKRSHSGQLSEELQKQLSAAQKPLFQSLGGTSAKQLAQYGRPRTDGMSLSRSIALFVGSKADYLLCAESGPGQADAKGLIVPKYGGKPEQRVAVGLGYSALNQMMLITRTHYEAWLTGWYAENYQAPTRQDGSVNGNSAVIENGKNDADDTQMF